MSASQKRAELKRLSKTVQGSIWEMLKIADELLHDIEYVDEFGGETGLIEHMQEEEFSHFGGSPGLPALLRAYRFSPKKSTWAEYRFDVWAMIDLAAPAKDGSETVRVKWMERCKAAEAKVVELEAVVADQRKTIASQQAQIDQLHAEVGELKGQLGMAMRFVPERAMR